MIYKSPYLWKQLHHMLLCLCHVMLLRLQANIWKQFDAISHCENYNMDWTKSCTWASSLFLDLSPLILLPKKKANANSCTTSKFQIFKQKSGFVVFFVTAFQKLATRLALRAESWSMDRSCSIEKKVVMNNTLRRRASDFHYLVEGEADVGSSPDGFDGSNVSLTWCWNYDYDDGKTWWSFMMVTMMMVNDDYYILLQWWWLLTSLLLLCWCLLRKYTEMMMVSRTCGNGLQKQRTWPDLTPTKKTMKVPKRMNCWLKSSTDHYHTYSDVFSPAKRNESMNSIHACPYKIKK